MDKIEEAIKLLNSLIERKSSLISERRKNEAYIRLYSELKPNSKLLMLKMMCYTALPTVIAGMAALSFPIMLEIFNVGTLAFHNSTAQVALQLGTVSATFIASAIVTHFVTKEEANDLAMYDNLAYEYETKNEDVNQMINALTKEIIAQRADVDYLLSKFPNDNTDKNLGNIENKYYEIKSAVEEHSLPIDDQLEDYVFVRKGM